VRRPHFVSVGLQRAKAARLLSAQLKQEIPPESIRPVSGWARNASGGDNWEVFLGDRTVCRCRVSLTDFLKEAKARGFFVFKGLIQFGKKEK